MSEVHSTMCTHELPTAAAKKWRMPWTPSPPSKKFRACTTPKQQQRVVVTLIMLYQLYHLLFSHLPVVSAINEMTWYMQSNPSLPAECPDLFLINGTSRQGSFYAQPLLSTSSRAGTQFVVGSYTGRKGVELDLTRGDYPSLQSYMWVSRDSGASWSCTRIPQHVVRPYASIIALNPRETYPSTAPFATSSNRGFGPEMVCVIGGFTEVIVTGILAGSGGSPIDTKPLKSYPITDVSTRWEPSSLVTCTQDDGISWVAEPELPFPVAFSTPVEVDGFLYLYVADYNASHPKVIRAAKSALTTLGAQQAAVAVGSNPANINVSNIDFSEYWTRKTTAAGEDDNNVTTWFTKCGVLPSTSEPMFGTPQNFTGNYTLEAFLAGNITALNVFDGPILLSKIFLDDSVYLDSQGTRAGSTLSGWSFMSTSSPIRGGRRGMSAVHTRSTSQVWFEAGWVSERRLDRIFQTRGFLLHVGVSTFIPSPAAMDETGQPTTQISPSAALRSPRISSCGAWSSDYVIPFSYVLPDANQASAHWTTKVTEVLYSSAGGLYQMPPGFGRPRPMNRSFYDGALVDAGTLGMYDLADLEESYITPNKALNPESWIGIPGPYGLAPPGPALLIQGSHGMTCFSIVAGVMISNGWLCNFHVFYPVTPIDNIPPEGLPDLPITPIGVTLAAPIVQARVSPRIGLPLSITRAIALSGYGVVNLAKPPSSTPWFVGSLALGYFNVPCVRPCKKVLSPVDFLTYKVFEGCWFHPWDGICKNCSSCATGLSFETESCGADGPLTTYLDRKCTSCNSCPTGEGELYPCQGQNNTICGKVLPTKVVVISMPSTGDGTYNNVDSNSEGGGSDGQSSLIFVWFMIGVSGVLSSSVLILHSAAIMRSKLPSGAVSAAKNNITSHHHNTDKIDNSISVLPSTSAATQSAPAIGQLDDIYAVTHTQSWVLWLLQQLAIKRDTFCRLKRLNLSVLSVTVIACQLWLANFFNVIHSHLKAAAVETGNIPFPSIVQFSSTYGNWLLGFTITAALVSALCGLILHKDYISFRTFNSSNNSNNNNKYNNSNNRLQSSAEGDNHENKELARHSNILPRPAKQKGAIQGASSSTSTNGIEVMASTSTNEQTKVSCLTEHTSSSSAVSFSFSTSILMIDDYMRSCIVVFLWVLNGTLHPRSWLLLRRGNSISHCNEQLSPLQHLKQGRQSFPTNQAVIKMPPPGAGESIPITAVGITSRTVNSTYDVVPPTSISENGFKSSTGKKSSVTLSSWIQIWSSSAPSIVPWSLYASASKLTALVSIFLDLPGVFLALLGGMQLIQLPVVFTPQSFRKDGFMLYSPALVPVESVTVGSTESITCIAAVTTLILSCGWSIYLASVARGRVQVRFAVSRKSQLVQMKKQQYRESLKKADHFTTSANVHNTLRQTSGESMFPPRIHVAGSLHTHRQSPLEERNFYTGLLLQGNPSSTLHHHYQQQQSAVANSPIQLLDTPGLDIIARNVRSVAASSSNRSESSVGSSTSRRNLLRLVPSTTLPANQPGGTASSRFASAPGGLLLDASGNTTDARHAPISSVSGTVESGGDVDGNSTTGTATVGGGAHHHQQQQHAAIDTPDSLYQELQEAIRANPSLIRNPAVIITLRQLRLLMGHSEDTEVLSAPTQLGPHSPPSVGGGEEQEEEKEEELAEDVQNVDFHVQHRPTQNYTSRASRVAAASNCGGIAIHTNASASTTVRPMQAQSQHDSENDSSVSSGAALGVGEGSSEEVEEDDEETWNRILDPGVA